MYSGHASANDAARDAASSIAGGLRQLVTATTEIVLIGVQNAGAAEAAFRTEEGHQLVFARVLGSAIRSGLDISQIAIMADLIVWATVFDVARIVVWTGSLAAFSQVAELVNVEAVLARSQAFEFSFDKAFGFGVGLRECDNAIGSLAWLGR